MVFQKDGTKSMTLSAYAHPTRQRQVPRRMGKLHEVPSSGLLLVPTRPYLAGCRHLETEARYVLARLLSLSEPLPPTWSFLCISNIIDIFLKG